MSEHQISAALRAELNYMLQRIVALEQRTSAAPAIKPGCCKKGKYVGQELEAIVKKDPDYVDWLETNNFAMGIGFTVDHIAAARKILRDRRESGGDWEGDK